MIVSEVAPISHNRDPEYCFLPEEWNPVQKNPKQILVFSKFGGRLRHGVSRDAVYTTDVMVG